MSKITQITEVDLVKIQELPTSNFVKDEAGYVPVSINGITYKVNVASIIQLLQEDVDQSRIDADKILPEIGDSSARYEELKTHTHYANSVTLNGAKLNAGNFLDQHLSDEIYKMPPSDNEIILVDKTKLPQTYPEGWSNISHIIHKSGTREEFNNYRDKYPYELVFITDVKSLKFAYNKTNAGSSTVSLSYLPVLTVLDAATEKTILEYEHSEGRIVKATDTHRLYYDDGANWIWIDRTVVEPYHGNLNFILPVTSVENEGTGIGFNPSQFTKETKYQNTEAFSIMTLMEVNDNDID